MFPLNRKRLKKGSRPDLVLTWFGKPGDDLKDGYTRTTFRMPTDIVQAARRMALDEGKPLTVWVREIIEAALAKGGRPECLERTRAAEAAAPRPRRISRLKGEDPTNGRKTWRRKT